MAEDLTKANLARKLPKGSKVYVYTIRKNVYALFCAYEGQVFDITMQARKVCGRSATETWSCRGHGLDDTHEIVLELANYLYNDLQALERVKL